MASKGFMVVVISWLTFAILDSMVSGTFTGQSTLNTLFNMEFVEWKDFLFIPIPVPNFDFISTVWTLATWNFFYFSGPLEYVRTIVALTIMGGLVWAIYTQLMPVFISAISSVGTLIRSLNPFSFLGG